MNDFWRSCGHHLLSRDAQGRLVAGDDYLRSWLRRPELALVDESCPAEADLHAFFADRPTGRVPGRLLDRVRDGDARENWRVFLRFRDRLLAAGSVEACYRGVVADPESRIAPLFVDQMAQLIVRDLLAGGGDAIAARAGELFFRAQRCNTADGRVMLADEETVEVQAESGGFGNLGRLLREAQTAPRSVDLPVLSRDNEALYWTRDERHDFVLDLTQGAPASSALARLLEAWVARMAGARVRVTPLARIDDEQWTWHLGLDAEASAILDGLYRGEEGADERAGQLLALYRLEFEDPSLVLERARGRPVYLGLARDGRDRLRMKPQNLLVNLPLAVAA